MCGSILTFIGATPTTFIVVEVVLKTGLPFQKQRVTHCNICRHLTGLLFVIAILQFRVFVIQTYCVNFSYVTCIRIILTRNIKCTTYDEPSKIINYEVLFASQIFTNYFLASFWCCHFWCPTYQIHLALNFMHCFKGNTTFLCCI